VRNTPQPMKATAAVITARELCVVERALAVRALLRVALHVRSGSVAR
jgi:hypothetical protein